MAEAAPESYSFSQALNIMASEEPTSPPVFRHRNEKGGGCIYARKFGREKECEMQLAKLPLSFKFRFGDKKQQELHEFFKSTVR